MLENEFHYATIFVHLLGVLEGGAGKKRIKNGFRLIWHAADLGHLDQKPSNFPK